MTRKELAAKAALQPRFIEKLEVESRSVLPSTIRGLCNALGCQPEDISEVVTPQEVAS
jgi:DNA-binding Xre family transcriptional regulator